MREALSHGQKNIISRYMMYLCTASARNNLIFGSDFENVEFYAIYCSKIEFVVSTACYRKFFDTEKAVPPKNQFLYGKGGTNNKFNFTTVPLVPRLVPHYRFFRRPHILVMEKI